MSTNIGRKARLPVSRRFLITCGLACATVVAACGGSDRAALTTRPRSPSTSVSVSRTAVAGIRSRVLANNELAGFASSGVSVYTTAQGWVSSPPPEPAAQAATEKAMLTRARFRAGAMENLTGAGTSGLSTVEQFGSPAAAKDALAFYIARLKAPGSGAGPYKSFKVSGIPGAVGFSLGGASGGVNIAFDQGDYYYLVGQGESGAAVIAALNAAARHLYDRVGGLSRLAAKSLMPYVIHGNEETGYPMQGAPKDYNTAASYAASEQGEENAQLLTRAGFQQALVENNGPQPSLSYVEQFATASDATRQESNELDVDLSTQGGGSFRFSVPGVPATEGFGVRSVDGSQGDANVLFREGRCLMLVGDMSTPHPKSYEKAVIAGVQAIHARTAEHHGACSG